MRALLFKFFFYVFFKRKGVSYMNYAIGLAMLILQKQFEYRNIPEGIVKDNVKLCLTVWGFPQLCEEQ